jgi:CRP-like cAMP-binding protein
MDFTSRSPNHFLSQLSHDDFELLRPHLRDGPLVHKTVLAKTDETMSRAYFPHSGVISLVVSLAGGEMVEIAMIGRDSVLGAMAALDDRVSLNEAIVQLPGTASTVESAILGKAAAQSASLRALLSRHEEFAFAQAQQSAACNASHTLHARLARWLMRIRDLTGSDAMPLTQEFLAQMLGVQRTSVSVVAHGLQQAGLIRYRRGRIEIVDLEGVKESACECYATVKARAHRLLNYEAK